MDTIELKNKISHVSLRKQWLAFIPDWMRQEAEYVNSVMSMNVWMFYLNKNFTKLKIIK